MAERFGAPRRRGSRLRDGLDGPPHYLAARSARPRRRASRSALAASFALGPLPRLAAPRTGCAFALPPGSRLMDTGGYKGRSRELPQAELYALARRLRSACRATTCVNMYGMTEHSTQFLDAVLRNRVCGLAAPRYKTVPPWARTRVLDPDTLRRAAGQLGLLCHYDLANRASVLAVLSRGRRLRGRRGLRAGRPRPAAPRRAAARSPSTSYSARREAESMSTRLLPTRRRPYVPSPGALGRRGDRSARGWQPPLSLALRAGSRRSCATLPSAAESVRCAPLLGPARDGARRRRARRLPGRAAGRARRRAARPGDQPLARPLLRLAAGWPSSSAGVTGYSAADDPQGAAGHLATFRPRTLWRLLEDELGDPRFLDEFRPRGAVGGRPRLRAAPDHPRLRRQRRPGLPAQSLACALLAKSASLGKAASEEPLFPALFVASLAEVDPRLAACFAVTWWPGGTADLEQVAFGRAEAVIAYGGEAAIDAVTARGAAADALRGLRPQAVASAWSGASG